MKAQQRIARQSGKQNMVMLLGSMVAFGVIVSDAWAAPRKIPPAVCGVIDQEVLQSRYKQYQVENAEFQRFVAQRKAALQVRQLLTEEEWKELDELEAKSPTELSAKEKKRLEELRKLSTQRGQELRKLWAVPNPSDEQKKRRQELENILRANRRRLDALRAALTKEITEKQKALEEKLRQQVRDVVIQVAAKYQLNIVFEKKAAIWVDNALDITEEVLKKLNER